MITRIELVNFMSHERTVIEPAPGLTVLVGPNNCGKSAVIAALQILCSNDNSNYVLRHGEKECSVTITTDDGHVVEWSRRKNSSRYSIDGEPFDRLNRNVPEKLHEVLRLGMVEFEQQSFDVHFGTQKSPIFLLDRPPTHAAQFFASSSDAIHLVAMQKRHREKLTDAQRQKDTLEVEAAEVNQQLEHLAPITQLDHELKSLEQQFVEIDQQATRLATARNLLKLWRGQAAQADLHGAAVRATAGLASPPQLAPVAPLAAHLQARRREEGAARQAAALRKKLAALGEPPEMAPVAPLQKLTGALARGHTLSHRLVARLQAAAPLSAPPEYADDVKLATVHRQLVEVSAVVQRNSAYKAAIGDLCAAPAMSDLKDLVRLVSALRGAQEFLQTHRTTLHTLETLAPAPEVADPTAVVVTLDRLRAAQAEVAKHHTAREQATAQCAAAADALRAWLAVQPLCPTCGSAIDAQNVLAIHTTCGAEVNDV